MAIEGDKLTWKKAQKKAKKNIISETMKKIIPYFKPLRTEIVWCPSLDSFKTTKNHAKSAKEKENHDA